MTKFVSIAIAVEAILFANCASNSSDVMQSRGLALNRELVSSCDTNASTTVPAFDARIDVGRAGGVDWLLGSSSGKSVLAHLDKQGNLVLLPVPLMEASAATVHGSKVFLFAGRTKSPSLPANWAVIDVANPAALVAGPVVPLPLGDLGNEPARFGPNGDRSAFIVGDTRAIIVMRGLADKAILGIDVKRNAPVGTPFVVEQDFEPVDAWCEGQGCFVVAIGGNKNPTVVRQTGTGAWERTQIGTDHAVRLVASRMPDRVVVVWLTHDHQLNLRSLGLDGRSLDGVQRFPLPEDVDVFKLEVPVAGNQHFIATAGKTGWSLAVLSPETNKIGPFVSIPASGNTLLWRAMDDGFVFVSHDSEVSYSISGNHGFHAWTSKASKGFVPVADIARTTAASLFAETGDGRGDYHPFMLAGKSRVGVLFVPRGEVIGIARLMILRQACDMD